VKRSLGFALPQIGVLLVLFAITVGILPMQEAFYGIDSSWPMLVRLALMFLGGISLFAGVTLVSLGMRCLQPTAEQLLSSDPRPPVIFLRSFSDDALTVQRKGSRLSAFDWVPNPTVESGITASLNRIGPVVAIGRPGEVLPRLGAARTYVSNSEWQEKVAAWMLVSRFVLLLVHHSTPGTHWELNHALTQLPAQRLVLCFPAFEKSEETRQTHYAAIREDLGGRFPKGLPESLGTAQFILFDPDWTPQKAENAHDLLARFSEETAHGSVSHETTRPARSDQFVSLVIALLLFAIGAGLEIAYIVHWGITLVESS
jgi:hypothetical protein